MHLKSVDINKLQLNLKLESIIQDTELNHEIINNFSELFTKEFNQYEYVMCTNKEYVEVNEEIITTKFHKNKIELTLQKYTEKIRFELIIQKQRLFVNDIIAKQKMKTKFIEYIDKTLKLISEDKMKIFGMEK